ncbi:nucleoside permease [Lutibacter sp.]|uniref:nucleoside permease n=1 Tax=Lutibacter sp. TaxID=1925666 RepID=UPI0025B89187|nr:nucleoside permease [Lutibacter sp.]MCF6182145.1 nucleoside permease [Lutibacter sp.]
MNIKLRLTVLNFLELFVFGAWLISLGGYLGGQLHFDGIQIGKIFSTLGIASLVMPAIVGIIADKYLNAQKLLGLLHLIGSIFLFFIAQTKDFDTFFWLILGYLTVYMPTIGLTNTVSYSILTTNKYDVIKVFPPIRVWGTIGFIVAEVAVGTLGWAHNNIQFYFALVISLAMGVYAFTMPNVPLSTSKNKSFKERLGLDAFALFKEYKIAVFFIFSMLLGVMLQISNMWASEFLRSFEVNFPNSFAVTNSNTLIALSQVSETLFILTIPFFLKRFGIKVVMIMSMLAWFFRFGLFGIGDPEGIGLGYLIMSMVVYGAAFDFFNISGSLFIETETDTKYRGSAQGLFILLTNGVGAVIGALGSGYVVDHFTTKYHKISEFTNRLNIQPNNEWLVNKLGSMKKEGIEIINGEIQKATLNVTDWTNTWFIFAAYALILAIIFTIVFKYKHNSDAIKNVNH